MDIARKLRMSPLPEVLAICRLDSDAAIPSWAATGCFFSITRASEELSIICPEANVPDRTVCSRGWRCLKVEGPLSFYEIGVVASLTAPLALADISVFIVSSYDTDYLLVKSENFERAVGFLTEAGHVIA
jgi:hypothetical protein